MVDTMNEGESSEDFVAKDPVFHRPEVAIVKRSASKTVRNDLLYPTEMYSPFKIFVRRVA